MADLLEIGSQWLQSQRKLHATRTVTYRRGTATVTVQATVGRTVFEQEDGNGAIVRMQVRDYLIDAADLVLGGQPTLPECGDRITETVGTTQFIYEVMPLGTEPHWRYSDPYRQTLRIHTKHITTKATI